MTSGLMLAAAVGLAAWAAPAFALAAPPAALKAFDIPAGPLAAALLQLARQGGVDVLAAEATTRGRSAPALHAVTTPATAIARLLAGSGLAARETADGSFIIELQGRAARPAPKPPVRLRDPPPPAAAQPPPGQALASLAEVVVTAERRSEDLLKVPISVSAFSQQALDQLDIRSTDQLQFATPGLINTLTSGDGISGFYIRGVGTGYSGPGLEGSVAFFQDDVYYQTQTASVQNAIDLAQVQVLQGPQGALYGRNATAGAIVITTADPRLGRLDGYVKTGFGGLDWKQVEGVVNLPLGRTLAARLVGFSEEREGYVKNTAFPGVKAGGVGAGETFGLRGKLLWAPANGVQTLATLSYDRRNGRGAIHSLRDYPDGANTGLGWYQTVQSPNREGGGGDDFDALLGSLRAQYRSGAWTWSNTLAFRRTRSFGCTDNDGLPEAALFFCIVSPRSPRSGGAPGKQDATLTDEMRVVSDHDGPLDLTAGLFFERNDARFAGRVEGSDFGSLLPTFDNRDRLAAYSGYLELYWRPADHVKLTGGLRYTYEEKRHAISLNADAESFYDNRVAAETHAGKTFSNLSPRAVLSYAPRDINYYASFNRGFKSGGFISPAVTLNPALEPETITAYEIGGKYRAPRGRFRINVVAFDYEWKNVQVAFITGGGTGIEQQNAAAARVRGGGASLDWTPGRSWLFGAGLQYMRGRYVSFRNAAVYEIANGALTAAAQDLSGRPLPNAPEFTGNASLTYTFSLPRGWSGEATAAGHYATSYDLEAGAGGQLRAARQPAYGLVNLTGTFCPPSDRVSLGWFVSNLFDARTIALISTGNTGVYMTPGAPRLYGVTLRYGF